jgi:hypothetical protein
MAISLGAMGPVPHVLFHGVPSPIVLNAWCRWLGGVPLNWLGSEAATRHGRPPPAEAVKSCGPFEVGQLLRSRCDADRVP